MNKKAINQLLYNNLWFIDQKKYNILHIKNTTPHVYLKRSEALKNNEQQGLHLTHQKQNDQTILVDSLNKSKNINDIKSKSLNSPLTTNPHDTNINNNYYEKHHEKPALVTAIKPHNIINHTPQNNNYQVLEESIKNCTKCALHKNRTNAVVGHGSLSATYMFIGDHVSKADDAAMLPFTGAYREYLIKMLAVMQLNIDTDVYLTNIVKCQSQPNQYPNYDEINSCNQYLQQQIQYIQPRVIITLGQIASQTLLNTDISINNLRNTIHTYEQQFNNTITCARDIIKIPVITTYSISYLLRNAKAKQELLQDLSLALTVLDKKPYANN